MAKDTYYFQHDYEPTGDPKVSALLKAHGAAGYGIYWRIIEMLHADERHMLPTKPYIYDAIASVLHTSAEQVEAVVNDCISRCDLLEENDGMISSRRVLRNIEKRADTSHKRSEAAKKRWECRTNKQQKDANALQVHTSALQNDAKERKGKKRKGNIGETASVDDVTAEMIYEAYPKRVDRGHAIPAIKKAMKKVQPAELLESVKAYSRNVVGKKEKQFIPNPATWFNGDRWADDDAQVVAIHDLAAMPWDELVALYKKHRPANDPTTNGLTFPREQLEKRLEGWLKEKGI